MRATFGFAVSKGGVLITRHYRAVRASEKVAPGVLDNAATAGRVLSVRSRVANVHRVRIRVASGPYGKRAGQGFNVIWRLNRFFAEEKRV
jgi:hypothetical protein